MTTYRLKSPIPSLTDKGYTQLGVSAYNPGVCMFQSSNGDYHALVSFTGPGTYLTHINMTTGASHVQAFTETPGSFDKHCFDPVNDNIYLGTQYGQGYVYKYNVVTFASTLIVGGGIYLGYSITQSADGYIWIAGTSNGPVYSYNPATSSYDNTWGNADTGCQYMESIAADADYIYCGLRPAVDGDGYYLSVIKRSDKSKTVYWKGDGNGYASVVLDVDSRPVVYHGAAGWFTMITGTLTSIATPTFSDPIKGRNCQSDGFGDFNTWENTYHYRLDLDLYLPIPVTQENSKVGYKTPVNAASYTYVQPAYTGPWVAGGQGAVSPISATAVAALGLGYEEFDYVLNTSAVKGIVYWSAYDMLTHPSGELFFFGYSASSYRYDPAAAYTLKASTNVPYAYGDGSKPNPYKLTLPTNGHYNFRGDYDAAGLVWIATNFTRTGTDYGILIWYNPTDGTSGTATSLTDITDPGNIKLRDILSIQGRTKIAVSGDNSNIYIVDAATKTLERAITPAGTSLFNAFIEAESGMLLVFSADITDTTGNVSLIQKVSSYDGSVLWSHTIGVAGQPFGLSGANSTQRYAWKFHKGPDGYGWTFVGDHLYRVNPNDGTFELVADITAGKLCWNGPDVIVYGVTHFYVYKNMMDQFNSHLVGGVVAHKVGGSFAKKVGGVTI